MVKMIGRMPVRVDCIIRNMSQKTSEFVTSRAQRDVAKESFVSRVRAGTLEHFHGSPSIMACVRILWIAFDHDWREPGATVTFFFFLFVTPVEQFHIRQRHIMFFLVNTRSPYA